MFGRDLAADDFDVFVCGHRGRQHGRLNVVRNAEFVVDEFLFGVNLVEAANAEDAAVDDEGEYQQAEYLKDDDGEQRTLLVVVKLGGQCRKFLHGDIGAEDGDGFAFSVSYGAREGGHQDFVIAAHVGLAPRSVAVEPFAVPGALGEVEVDNGVHYFLGFFVLVGEVSVADAVAPDAIDEIDADDFGVLCDDAL